MITTLRRRARGPFGFMLRRARFFRPILTRGVRAPRPRDERRGAHDPRRHAADRQRRRQRDRRAGDRDGQRADRGRVERRGGGPRHPEGHRRPERAGATSSTAPTRRPCHRATDRSGRRCRPRSTRCSRTRSSRRTSCCRRATPGTSRGSATRLPVPAVRPQRGRARHAARDGREHPGLDLPARDRVLRPADRRPLARAGRLGAGRGLRDPVVETARHVGHDAVDAVGERLVPALLGVERVHAARRGRPRACRSRHVRRARATTGSSGSRSRRRTGRDRPDRRAGHAG